MRFKASAKQTTQEWRIKKISLSKSPQRLFKNFGNGWIFASRNTVFSHPFDYYAMHLCAARLCRIQSRPSCSSIHTNNTQPSPSLKWKWKIKTNSGTAEIHWVVTGNCLKIPILMENCSGTRADCIGARHPTALDRLSCKISDSQSYVSLDI